MSEAARPLLLAGLLAVLAGCGGPPDAVASRVDRDGEDRGGRGDWQTLSLSRDLAGEERLAVDIEYGAGQLTVRPGEGDRLYQARMRYDASAFEPVTRYADGRLQIGMEGAEVRGRRVDAGSLEVALNPTVALDLDLEFGAAEADLELGGLRLERLEISTGASRTKLSFSEPNAISAESISLQIGAAQFEAIGLGNARAQQLSVEGGVGDIMLDFSGAWTGDLNATVEMGLGKLTLRLPEGLGVRIEKDGVLASLKGEGLTQQDNVYYTADFDRAARKLRLDVDAAFNAIDIVWTDPIQTNGR